MQKLLSFSLVLFLLFALSACSSEEAPPSEEAEAEAKEQTVNAQPKENLDLLNVDRGLAIHK